MIAWGNIEEFEKEFEKEPKNLRYTNKKLAKILMEKYPDPLTYFSSSETVKYQGYSEVWYVIYWAWKSNAFTINDYREKVLKYLMNQKELKVVYRFWTIKLGLMNEAEWDVINSFSRARRKTLRQCIPLLVFFNNKPLNEISEKELDSLPELYSMGKGIKYSKKLASDLLITLGYTNKIVEKNNFSRSNWNKHLIKDHFWGSMFKEYYDYLIRARAKKNYLAGVSTALVALMKFLETKNLNDCSDFDETLFNELTDFLLETRSPSTVSVMIPKYKKFFEWGVNYNNFFPTKLNYPVSRWKELYQEAREEYAKSDGRAFKNEEIVDSLVKVLMEIKPSDEEEEMCLYFWQIISSCPARFSFIHKLEAKNALLPLPNEPNAFGVYSLDSDKAGNKSGQFPVLDELGISAIRTLQARARKYKFKPLFNKKAKRAYVHLFQLPYSPWILKESKIKAFLNDKVKPRVIELMGLEDDTILGGAHGFRHYILTEIVKRTGSIVTAQVAAGHTDYKMTKIYTLKSKHSRKALLYRVIDKFEKGEITGKFYLRLVELLTNDDSSDQMMTDLTREISLAEFISMHGRKTEMGYCFHKDTSCKHYLKCWGCPHFLLTREEIEGAVKLLKNLIEEFMVLKSSITDFSYENQEVQTKFMAIGLIIERLKDLGFEEEEIDNMVLNYPNIKAGIRK